MKKIFAILMLIFILASCNTPIPTENEEKAEPTYFYFLGKRINAETGNITDLCGDPLCSHDTVDCPFYGFDPFLYEYKIMGDHIYYMRPGQSFYRDPDPKLGEGGPPNSIFLGQEYLLCDYDIKNNSVEIMLKYELGESPPNTVCYDELNRYIYCEYFGNADGERLNTLERIHMETYEREVVLENYDGTMTMCHTDGKNLYYQQMFTETPKKYKSDMNGENLEEIKNFVSGYVLKEDGNYYHVASALDGTICKTDGVTGEVTILDTESLSCNAYNGYIYYTRTEPEETRTQGQWYSNGEPVDFTLKNNGKIWRMKYDGTGREVFAETGVSLFVMNGIMWQFDGDYMACIGNHYEPDENGIYKNIKNEGDTYSVYIVNLTTGKGFWVTV